MSKRAAAQEKPYLGALISACLHQRGARIRATAMDLAKQAAVLMIENFRVYSEKLDGGMAAEMRNQYDRIPPILLHQTFDDVHMGKYPTLAKAREALGIGHQDSKLLRDPFLVLSNHFLPNSER